jgi:hypothetical protein
MDFYAHSLEGRLLDEWHRLEDHLTPSESSPWQGEAWRGGALNLPLISAVGNGGIWWGYGMIWGKI